MFDVPKAHQRKVMAHRAREYRRRATKLAAEAEHARDADDRRHLLELAETYQRAADQVAPSAAACPQGPAALAVVKITSGS